MKGSNRSRNGSRALRKRCSQCSKLRKFCEPPFSQGGEKHPRRPNWVKVNDNWICGWCNLRNNQITEFFVQDNETTLSRNSLTGKIIKSV